MGLRCYSEAENIYFGTIIAEYKTTKLPTETLKQYYTTFVERFCQDYPDYTLSQFSAKYYDMRRKLYPPTSSQLPGYAKSSAAEKEVMRSVKELVDENKKLIQENKELRMELRKLKEVRQAVENYQKNK